MYFPVKDKTDIFRVGVAIADNPTGPFKALPDPIRGSYSIDMCVLEDDGQYYMYFGGIWGGQLQRYRNNCALDTGTTYPADDDPAICPKIVKISDDMTQFAEAPRDVQILDEDSNPLKTKDFDRRFFEASWTFKKDGKYYFTYSTGDTHNICYAIGDNPYGPFKYCGVILTEVIG